MTFRLQTFLAPAVLACCAITTTVAVLVLWFIAADPSQAWIWPRILSALFILAMNGGIVACCFRPTMRMNLPLVLGGAALTALGAAGAVHGYFMAHLNGDLEAWAILACIVLVIQGTSTLLLLFSRQTPSLAG